MDKAYVLGYVINHMEQLQEQVKLLEQNNQRKTIKSMVYVEKTKSRFSNEDDSYTSSNSENGHFCRLNRSLPEVEAIVSEKKCLHKFIARKKWVCSQRR